jgi:hypothetical protein
MRFRIRGLDAKLFRPLFALSKEQLHAQGIHTQFADESRPGFPCRIRLGHAACGERLLLLNYVHQPAASPYHSAHAIYVAENSVATFDEVDVIPPPIRERLLSIRAFGADHMMIDADVIDGTRAEELLDRLLANPDAQYLHIHYAKRGCYAARVDRIDAAQS